MEKDRINFLLENDVGEVVFSAASQQWIFPAATFTCSGNIRGWVFGAQLGDYSGAGSFVELQLWRPSEGGRSYTVVWRTMIMEQNVSQLFSYELPSSAPFQAGDVFGFYQPPNSKGLLLLERRDSGNAPYKLTSDSAMSQVTVGESNRGIAPFQTLIHPLTGKKGYTCLIASYLSFHIIP